MSTTDPRIGHDASHRDDSHLSGVRNDWTLFAGLGAFTILLGLVLIVTSLMLSRTTALAGGWLMLLAGVTQLGAAYGARPWTGSAVALLNGVMYGIIAIVLFSEHRGDVGGLMIAVATLVATVGLIRIGITVMKPFTHREVTLFNGAVALVIAGMIWGAWYGNMPWAIGVLLGIEVILTGIAWIAFSTALRQRSDGART